MLLLFFFFPTWLNSSKLCQAAQSIIMSGRVELFSLPAVFLDDTMQGISGRKVRLEGGETLQSSLVTMR